MNLTQILIKKKLRSRMLNDIDINAAVFGSFSSYFGWFFGIEGFLHILVYILTPYSTGSMFTMNLEHKCLFFNSFGSHFGRFFGILVSVFHAILVFLYAIGFFNKKKRKHFWIFVSLNFEGFFLGGEPLQFVKRWPFKRNGKRW